MVKGKQVNFSRNQFKAEIQANPTADRVVNLPDKAGTIAFLDDISGGSGPSVIRQATKPTVRSDGSALQVGDTWTQSGAILTLSEWVWNGQYWVSRQLVYGRWASTTTITAAVPEVTLFEPEPGYGLWLHEAKFFWRSGALHDGASSFTPTLIRRNDVGTNTVIFSITTNPTPASTRITQTIPCEFLLDVDALAINSLRFSAPRVGSTATLTALKIILPMRVVHLN